MRSTYHSRRQRPRIVWRGPLLSVILALLVMLPTAGLVTVLLGIAHAADPVIPPLGWRSTYTLMVVVYLVSLTCQAEVTLDE